jgi:hypothetical protein
MKKIMTKHLPPVGPSFKDNLEGKEPESKTRKKKQKSDIIEVQFESAEFPLVVEKLRSKYPL